MSSEAPARSAVRVAVAETPDLDPDYADAFAVRIDPASERTSLDWARAVFEGAPVAARWFLQFGWRVGLGLPLGPRKSPDHVLGWLIVASAPDLTRIRLQSKLMTSVVEYRVESDRLTLTTRVTYHRPVARLLWAAAAPIHRLIIPYLLGRAASDAGNEISRGA